MVLLILNLTYMQSLYIIVFLWKLTLSLVQRLFPLFIAVRVPK